MSEKQEFEVRLFYKAFVDYKIEADDRVEAHKKAYNKFMDSPCSETFNNSQVQDFFIETSIDGYDGSDVLHD